MVRADIKGVFPTYKLLKDGTRRTYWYHRATGERLRGEPGSPEFIADLAAAEKLIRDRLAGTFNSLIRSHTASIEFEQKLAPSTQAEYRRMLTKAETEFGDMPIAALDDPRVRKDLLEWREKIARASGQREGDNRLSAISAMLTWCVDRGTLTANHLRGFKRLYHADRSEIIWLPEHIAAFMKVAPVEMQRALILALHTGQREGDLLRLPWSAYKGDVIELRQGKARRLGQAAAAFEAQFLVDLLVSNAGLGPVMKDGNELFDATHGNVATSGAAPSETTLSAARLAMRKQTGLGGGLIDATPFAVLVSADLETSTEKVLTAIRPVTVSDANPFSTLRLIVEPRLTDTYRWYVTANPATVDGLEFAYLAGAPGPQVESQAGFRIDGVEIRVRLDYGAGFVDHRGWYSNAGH